MLDGFRDPNDTFFPPLLCNVVTIPSASILTMFTTAFTIIPARSNSFIIPEKMLLVKQVGTIAYTTAGVTNLYGNWGISGAVSGSSWLQSSIANLAGFISVLPLACLLNNYGLASGGPNRYNPDAAGDGITGNPVTLTFSGANPAAGNSDFKLWIKYRIWPVANLAWF